ncbi:hypothetical protein MCOR27_004711 [Pyricularia oryzae]|nr:hypothetical protein MCOR19_002348 [Pyricularia oryzae]KAI6269678.1 hypothetical protein MCOR26_008596 [Pyricularia oryzae]KAI6280291.1 hypothetical protein MCOR27_004711 [Pyricularia oryzae]KAI6323458.1 hypothetical protein MCOR30_007302 [Pyricularia oryzae]KAI6329181.1 hypothetical protein MCOR29_002307 [Pyricularia oryzae]
MRFFSAALFIVGLAGAACAMVDQAGDEANLQRRSPAVKRPNPLRPNRAACRERNDGCTKDYQCCSGDCETQLYLCN